MSVVDKKLRQITDNIHETIYMSELESLLGSSPFFYRLHDIYQSSTVYLTFPSNRTKRYEHSLGTMQIASQNFYHAIVNAEQSVVAKLFDGLKSAFEARVMNRTVSLSEDGSLPDDKSVLFDKLNEIEQLKPAMRELAKQSFEHIHELLNNEFTDANPSCIDDIALSHFIPHNLPTLRDVPSTFLYRSIFQAIRIVALYHDVGHPPYSHIIEEVLENLKNIDPTLLDKKKSTTFHTCLALDQKKIDITEESLSIPDAHLHELIGISMLGKAFSMYLKNTFPSILLNGKKYAETTPSERNEIRIRILYIMAVIEFAFAIMCDKEPLFSNLHRIIDGLIDSDRLDYVTRDTHNSGINWGEPPYRRLINSAKFAITDKTSDLVVCFPKKMADDIDDFLQLRYKLFIRINFHHRSVKTATILKKLVFSLACLYLKSDVASPIDDIKNLWLPLRSFWTDERNAIAISRWHDSWLITLLYETYIYLFNKREDLTVGSKEWDQFVSLFDDSISGCTLGMIIDYLEELLFNTKHYYSVIKRIGDETYIAQRILKDAGITETYIAESIAKLEDLREHSTSSDTIEDIDSALVLLRLLKRHCDMPIFSMFKVVFGFDIDEHIRNVLDSHRKSNRILDYIFETNTGRNKLGIVLEKEKDNSDHSIWLYDSSRSSYTYDDDALRASMFAIKRSTVQWFVYVKLPDAVEPKKRLADIRTDISKSIAEYIKTKLEHIMAI